MKTRTKLLTALLSTVTALSCALTAAAATTPSIKLQGNEMTPADGTKDGELQFTITATNFEDVAGADLEITIPNGLNPNTVEVKSNNSSWNALYANDPNGSGNYIFKDNVLKIVDVFNVGKNEQDKITALNLTVTVNYTEGAKIGTYPINFSNQNVKLVGEDLKDIECTVTNASLVVGKESAAISGAESGKCFDDKDKFLPYGVLTDNKGNFLTKDESGKFKFDGPKDAYLFKQPENNNVTTFGVSGKSENGVNTIQFGSYINDIATDADSCGTVLVFSKEPSAALKTQGYSQGDFDGALAAAGSLKALLEGIVKAYEGVKDKTKFYPYAYGDPSDKKIIYVRVVQQTKYMWRLFENKNLKKLQYSVRCKVSNGNENNVFTAAGYIKTADTYSFSKEVKSAAFNNVG